MGSVDDLLHTRDQIVGSDSLRRKWARSGGRTVLRWRKLHVRPTDVVDSFQKNDVADTWLRQNIPIKTGERIDPGAVVQDAIASDPFVENGETRPTVQARRFASWSGQSLYSPCLAPTPSVIESPSGNDCASQIAGPHLEIGKTIPGLLVGWAISHLHRKSHRAGDIGIMLRPKVGRRCGRAMGQINADRDFGERPNTFRPDRSRLALQSES